MQHSSHSLCVILCSSAIYPISHCSQYQPLEFFALLGFYVSYIIIRLPTFRENLSDTSPIVKHSRTVGNEPANCAALTYQINKRLNYTASEDWNLVSTLCTSDDGNGCVVSGWSGEVSEHR
jgi:hypothetical protein